MQESRLGSVVQKARRCHTQWITTAMMAVEKQMKIQPPSMIKLVENERKAHLQEGNQIKSILSFFTTSIIPAFPTGMGSESSQR